MKEWADWYIWWSSLSFFKTDGLWCNTFPSHSNHVQSAVHTADILPVSVLMIWGTQRPGACSIQCVLAWNSSTLVRWRTRAGSSVSFSCSVRAWRCRNRACLQDTHSHTSRLHKWIKVKSFVARMCFHYLSFFLSPFFSMNPQTSAQVSKLVTKSSMDCKHRKQIHLTYVIPQPFPRLAIFKFQGISCHFAVTHSATLF